MFCTATDDGCPMLYIDIVVLAVVYRVYSCI